MAVVVRWSKLVHRHLTCVRVLVEVQGTQIPRHVSFPCSLSLRSLRPVAVIDLILQLLTQPRYTTPQVLQVYQSYFTCYILVTIDWDPLPFTFFHL